jgi:hypothetical protein
MPNNPNSGVVACGWLAYMEDLIKEALDLTMDIDLDECDYYVHISNHKNPSLNDPKLLDIGDGKCYCPCIKCKDIEIKIINRSATGKIVLNMGSWKG